MVQHLARQLRAPPGWREGPLRRPRKGQGQTKLCAQDCRDELQFTRLGAEADEAELLGDDAGGQQINEGLERRLADAKASFRKDCWSG